MDGSAQTQISCEQDGREPDTYTGNKTMTRCDRCGLNHGAGECLFDDHPELLGPRIKTGMQAEPRNEEQQQLDEERRTYRGWILEHAERASKDAETGGTAEWALMKACGPLLIASECGELDSGVQILAGQENPAADIIGRVDDGETQNQEKWRAYAAKRRNPDVDRFYNALDDAIKERDGTSWSKEKEKGAIRWMATAREMAMVQRTPTTTAEETRTLALRMISAYMGEQTMGASQMTRTNDGTLVWSNNKGEQITFATWITSVEKDPMLKNPTQGIGHAQLQGVTLTHDEDGQPERMTGNECIQVAEATGGWEEKLRTTITREDDLRWAIMHGCGLEGKALNERSLITAEYAAEYARNKLCGQSEEFNKTLEEGCKTARKTETPVEAQVIESAMSLRQPSPFNAPWSKGPEKAARTDAALDAALEASDEAHGFKAMEYKQEPSGKEWDTRKNHPIEDAIAQVLKHGATPQETLKYATDAIESVGTEKMGDKQLDEAITGNAWAADEITLIKLEACVEEAKVIAAEMHDTPDEMTARTIRRLARGVEILGEHPIASACVARASARPCLEAPPESGLAIARRTILRFEGRTARADAEQSVRWAHDAIKAGVKCEKGGLATIRAHEQEGPKERGRGINQER